MPKLCLSCYEIYDEGLYSPPHETDYVFCPKASCVGEVVEIDELLLPIIVELNQKGYFTRFCCSGHYYDNCPNCYISFDEDVVLPSVPRGFVLEGDNIIRKNFKRDDNYKGVFLDTLETTTALLKWTHGLPDFDWDEVGEDGETT